MTLDQYLADQGLTDEAFAALAGLSQPHVNRLKRGKADPSVSTIRAIARASDGLVGPLDWFADQNNVKDAAPATSCPEKSAATVSQGAAQ